MRVTVRLRPQVARYPISGKHIANMHIHKSYHFVCQRNGTRLCIHFLIYQAIQPW